MFFSGLRARLIRFISHLSSMMSQNPNKTVITLSPGGAGGAHRVDGWIGHATSSEVLSVSRRNIVVFVSWLKMRQGVEHEAAEFKVTDGSDALYILVERAGSVQRTPSASSSTPNLSATASNTSADRSGELSSHFAAQDNVTVSATSFANAVRSKYRVVARLNIPVDSADPFTVSDLAALLSVVSLSQPEYNFYSYNCYWFVAVIIYVIEAQHGGHVDFTKIGTSPGHLGILPVMSVDERKEAVLKVMPIWAARKEVYRAKKTTEEVCLGLFVLSWSSINHCCS